MTTSEISFSYKLHFPTSFSIKIRIWKWIPCIHLLFPPNCLSLIRLDVSVEITPCLFVVNTILFSCLTPRRFNISLEKILLENSMWLILYMSKNKFNFFQLESKWILIQFIFQLKNTEEKEEDPLFHLHLFFYSLKWGVHETLLMLENKDV